MSALTPKQQQIYDFILSFSGRHGYPPSVREIGEHVGLKSPEGAGDGGADHQGQGEDPGHHRLSRAGGDRPRAGAGAHCGQCGRRRPHPGPGVH